MLHGLVHRALRSRLARSSLTCAGIVACTLLVLVLLSAYRGVRESVAAYADRKTVDLWVAPRGTDNLVRSSGVLSPEQLTAVEATAGVHASPILRSFVSVETRGRRVRGDRALTLLAIGYRAPHGLGGPPKLAFGREPRSSTEVVLDRAAAYRLGVETGAGVLVNGTEMKLVGLSEHTNLLSTQFMFCDIAALQSATGLGRGASFLLLQARGAGVDASALVARIEANAAGVSVFTRQNFAANNAREVTAGILPLIGLITLLGVLVSAVLVAMLIQVLVDDRRADLCVLIAMGVSQVSLVVGALRRVVTLVLGSVVAGWVSTVALIAGLDHWLPTVPLASSYGDVFFGSGLFVLCASAAALVPLLRISRLDPLEAFRS